MERPRSHWAGKPFRKQALVPISRPSDLHSRRAQVSPPLISHEVLKGTRPPLKQHRQEAEPTCCEHVAGEKSDIEESSLSEVAGFLPATGDPRSPAVLPSISATAFHAQLPPLCASASLRLCVSFR